MIPYPLSGPTVVGNDITVDLMLNEPTRITRYLSDLTLQGFFADRIFPNAGGVSGGAVLYNQLTENDLYPTRDVDFVEPGAEFPIVDFARPTPRTAQVEKFGGKFFVTDEAVRRNDSSLLRQGVQKLANAIQRKIHERALTVLNDEWTALGVNAQVIAGSSWQTATTTTNTNATPAAAAAATFQLVQLVADRRELAVTFDTYIVNPKDAMHFKMAYGNQWQSVLNDNGISSFIVTNRQPEGWAWALESGTVGEMRLEVPLSTRTWEDSDGREVTWVQSGVRPVFYVTNPYSIAKVTGL
jgi:hypothetical protein